MTLKWILLCILIQISLKSASKGSIANKSASLAQAIADSTKPSPEPTWTNMLNSLAPGKFEWDFRHVIFKQILVIDGWGISC